MSNATLCNVWVRGIGQTVKDGKFLYSKSEIKNLVKKSIKEIKNEISQ
jgi:hypothetical protein